MIAVSAIWAVPTARSAILVVVMASSVISTSTTEAVVAETAELNSDKFPLRSIV